MTQAAIPPVVPDYLGGVIARLKAHPDATLLASLGGQISTALGAKWVARTRALLVRRAGSPGFSPEAGRGSALVDTFWYGPTEYEAQRLWAAYHFWICPDPQFAGALNTYRPGPSGLVFDEVDHVGGPVFQVEQQTAWPYLVARYLVIFSAVPVA